MEERKERERMWGNNSLSASILLIVIFSSLLLISVLELWSNESHGRENFQKFSTSSNGREGKKIFKKREREREKVLEKFLLL